MRSFTALTFFIGSASTHVDQQARRFVYDSGKSESASLPSICSLSLSSSPSLLSSHPPSFPLRCHQAVSNMLRPHSRLQFSDVAGLSIAKQSLREALIMPLQYPHLFTGARQPWQRILLYGPPGTGTASLKHVLHVGGQLHLHKEW